MPFYMLRINPDGSCTPCCDIIFRASLGNVSETSLPDIWNGKKFNQLRSEMLKGVKNVNGICKKCRTFAHATCAEDILDNDAERLKQFYDQGEKNI